MGHRQAEQGDAVTRTAIEKIRSGDAIAALADSPQSPKDSA